MICNKLQTGFSGQSVLKYRSVLWCSGLLHNKQVTEGSGGGGGAN